MSDFLAMGGHGIFIWPCFIIVLGGMFLMYRFLLNKHNHTLKTQRETQLRQQSRRAQS